MIQVVVPEKRVKPRSFSEQLGEGLGRATQMTAQHLMGQQEKQAANEAYKRITGEDLSGLNPEDQAKIAAYLLQGKQKTDEANSKLQGNRNTLRGIEKNRGLQEGSLSDFESDPKAAEVTTRPNKTNQADRPIDPDQLRRINKARSKPGFDDLDELGQYRELTNEGVSERNAESESKLRGSQLTRQGQLSDKAYEAQKDFIEDTTNKFRAYETETKPKLLQMGNIPDEDLIGPTAATFLETLGIPLGALEDPSSELYQKLSLDLLKGLPESYGNRILKVEVDNFLKTIPSLLNSADGRRMIASNFLKLGEMKEVYYNEMRRQQKDYLDSSKPLPKDFQQRIFDQVKPQINRINNEFVKLSEIKAVPKNTIPFFSPNGEIEFVPKEHAQWASENGGRRIW